MFWVSVYGVHPGDTEITRLVAPDGAVVAANTRQLPDGKAQWFSFVGRKRRGAAWAAGAYRGEYRLLRAIEGEPREVLSAVRMIAVR